MDQRKNSPKAISCPAVIEYMPFKASPYPPLLSLGNALLYPETFSTFLISFHYVLFL